MNPKLKQILEKIYGFRDTVPDHNGYDQPESIEILAEFNAICFLMKTNFLPNFVSPLNGGIRIHFDIADDKEVNVAFWNDGEIDYHDQPSRSWIFTVKDLPMLEEMLKKDLNNECKDGFGVAKRPKR